MKKCIITGAAALFLIAVLGLLAGCSGAFTDPGHTDAGVNGGGGGWGSGSGNGTKPEKLAGSATAAQARAKLDEIIAYSGTPAVIKDGAEAMISNWSSNLTSTWQYSGQATIFAINQFIDTIP
jgi:hypothetical protein